MLQVPEHSSEGNWDSLHWGTRVPCSVGTQPLCSGVQSTVHLGAGSIEVLGLPASRYWGDRGLVHQGVRALPSGGLGLCALVGSGLCASGYQSSVQRVDWCSVHEGARALCTGVLELHAPEWWGTVQQGDWSSAPWSTRAPCTGEPGLCAGGYQSPMCQSSVHWGNWSSMHWEDWISVPRNARGCQTSMHQEIGVLCTGGSGLCAPGYHSSTHTGDRCSGHGGARTPCTGGL